ncbi:hypothetical protein EVAR_15958_1 [Eumeta japonica]|uniref:Uncharacterized protein n=1 Tax=Eumeta variegata TaxID=151549 RepID=A0A4C1UL86_EUMVA|nr:hypothetical protein EVAR_15958_1 [Eumeta japonica]
MRLPPTSYVASAGAVAIHYCCHQHCRLTSSTSLSPSTSFSPPTSRCQHQQSAVVHYCCHQHCSDIINIAVAINITSPPPSRCQHQQALLPSTFYCQHCPDIIIVSHQRLQLRLTHSQ